MYSTKQLILSVLQPEPSYLTSAEIYKAVLRIQPGVVESTVRNELSNMVADPNFPVTSVRRGFYAKKSAPFDYEVNVVASSLRNLLNAITNAGISVTPDGYRSPAFALIDCIFSARAQYSSVTALIARVSAKLGVTDADEIGIRDFVSMVTELTRGVEDVPYWLANTFFENRSYAGKELTKAVQVFIVAQRLLTLHETNSVLWDLDKKSDFNKISHLNSDDAAEFLRVFEVEMTRLRGWGPALHRYLLLLLGVSQVSKPDQRIIEFISRSLGRAVSSIEPRYAAFLFEDAVRLLNEEGITFNVIESDHAVWLFISGRIKIELETDSRPNEVVLPRPSMGVNTSFLAETSPRLQIGDLVTSKSGPLTRIGEIVGIDQADPLRFIVKWPGDGVSPTFKVEQVFNLSFYRTTNRGLSLRTASVSPPNRPSNDNKVSDLFLTQRFETMINESTTIGRNQGADRPVSSSVDNHMKLELAFSPHRGKSFSTAQMWNIVDAMWHGTFTKGSFLPNDHASGNKGSCWCAENRENTPLFQKINRGFYHVL
jgi:hypothetical protein